jgi:hypothetical protein
MMLWMAYVTRMTQVPLASPDWRQFGMMTLRPSTTQQSRMNLTVACTDPLRRMVRGRWLQHPMTDSQTYEMKMFHNKVSISVTQTFTQLSSFL